MPLMTRVKINGIGSLHEARYGAGMGVDRLGLVTEPEKKGYMSPETASQIAPWLSGVQFVGEVSGSAFPSLAESYPVQYWEVTDERLLSNTPKNLPIIFKINALQDIMKIENLLKTHKGTVESFVLSWGEASIPSERLIWLAEQASYYPIWIEAAFEAVQIPELISKIPVQGICVQGAREVRTGINDFDHLAPLLEVLETDEWA